MNPLQCSKCLLWKEPSEFHLATKTQRGRHRYCKECFKEYSANRHGAIKQRNIENPPQVLQGVIQCTACQCWKESTEFHKDLTMPDGIRHTCRDCIGARMKHYYVEHQEEQKQKSVQWRLDHPEAMQEQQRLYRESHKTDRYAKAAEWRAAHPEKTRELYKRWATNNPDKRHALNQQRRARKRNAPVIERISRTLVYKRDKGICSLCHRPVKKAEMSLDHIIPLSKGGEHSYKNICLTHLGCNIRKGNRPTIQQLRLF